MDDKWESVKKQLLKMDGQLEVQSSNGLRKLEGSILS